MPVRATPESATEKWVNGLAGSTQAVTAGVGRVQVAPGQKAAAKLDKYLQGVQNSANKWRQRVASVSLQDWQQSMIQIGIPRIAQGAQAKKGKMQQFLTEFLPYLQSGLDRIDSMPDTTYEQRIQKMLAMVEHSHQFKRSGA